MVMNIDKVKSHILKLRLLAIVLIITATGQLALCETEGYVLMVEQSPIDAGYVTPKVGIHGVKLNHVVTLTASAKPGYQFVYWLGDVTEPTSNQTTMLLDGPKIVVAVFERSEFEFLDRSAVLTNNLGPEYLGKSGTYNPGGPPALDGSFIPGKRRRPPEFELPDEDFPVPDDPETPEDEFPVPDEPVPEPATIVLFAIGTGYVLRKRSKNQ